MSEKEITMRIAFYTDNFDPELGGIQDSILAITRELGLRGHKILIVAPSASPRDYARVNRPPVEIDLGPNIQICRLLSVPFPSSSQQSRWGIPTAKGRRRVEAFDPQVIHSHGFLSVGREALRMSRRLGCPIIGTNHWAVGGFDMYIPFARTFFGEACTRSVTRYFEKCDEVSAPSKDSVDTMREYGLSRPCTAISNPIDTLQFRPVSPERRQAIKSELTLGDKVIVAAGRLGREKRLDVLIRAVALVKKQVPDVSLVIAGHGSAKESLETLARECNLSDAVRFVGTLNQEALAKLFSAAEVFSIASTSETQSMVLLQAMACGLPVVGARSGGLTEHIPPKVGFQSEPGNSEDFADNLVRILTAPDTRERMKQEAISFAREFSVSSISDIWEELYSKWAACEVPEGSRTECERKESEKDSIRSVSCV